MRKINMGAVIIFFLWVGGCNVPPKGDSSAGNSPPPSPSTTGGGSPVPDATQVPTGNGKTFYVSLTGSDTNPGTEDRPWGTIQYAGRTAKPGDTVLIRGGEYAEGEIYLRVDSGYTHCGSEKGMLTIRNAPGEVVLLTNGNRPFIADCNYIRVQGLHFRNGKSIAVWGLDRTNLQFVNNTFKGKGYAYGAITTHGNNILIEGNECDVLGNTEGTQGHCFYISHGSNITLHNNIAKGPTGYGIHVFDQRRSEDPANFKRLIKNVLIEGNTTSYSESRAGIIVASSDETRIEDVIIRNNLVYGNGGNGITIRSNSRNVQIYNNTIFDNGTTGIAANGTAAIGLAADNGDAISNILIKNNILAIGSDSGLHFDVGVYHGGTIDNLVIENNFYSPAGGVKSKFYGLSSVSDAKPHNGDPSFVNPNTFDLHLLAASPAIDQGLSLPEVPSDKDGTVRPQGAAYDIGAYEFQKK